MNIKNVYILDDRAILYLNGEDTKEFLQNLISNDINKVSDNNSCFTSLLSPQGKFLYEFVIIKHKSGYLIDCEKSQVDGLFKQLSIYKLRSKVEILNLSNEFVVAAFSHEKFLNFDEAQDIVKALSLKAYEGGYKVMLIWMADKMNTACANKLLKLIEEPPDKTVFILIAEDDLGCSYSDTISLLEPTDLTATLDSIANTTCFGADDGYIGVSPSGGRNPYTFEWNDPLLQTDSFAANLPGSVAGLQYRFILRDSANICADTTFYTITSPISISFTKDSTNILCFNNTTGTARVLASNGTPPYRYSWSPIVDNDSSLTNVGAGFYKVEIRDTNNCFDTATFNIQQPDTSLYGFFSNVDSISCNGLTDGSIDLTPLGGSGLYTYAWSTGATTEDLSGLSAGTYSVVLTDTWGCSDSTTFVITEPAALSISINASGNTTICINESRTLSLIGFAPPVNLYQWSDVNGIIPGATASTYSATTTGTYSLTVTTPDSCVSVSNGIAITVLSTAVPSSLFTSNIQLSKATMNWGSVANAHTYHIRVRVQGGSWSIFINNNIKTNEKAIIIKF